MSFSFWLILVEENTVLCQNQRKMVQIREINHGKIQDWYFDILDDRSSTHADRRARG